MTRRRIFGIHFAAWAMYVVYQVLGDFIMTGAGDSNIYLALSFTFVRVFQFYFCYLVVFPLFGRRDRLVPLILGIVAALALFTGLRYLVEEVLLRYLFGFGNYGDGTTFKYYVTDNLYWGAPGIMLAAVLWSVEKAFRREQENKLLRQEVTRAELAFLKSQINPHFLYNSLNYIYSLAIPVSEKLANAVLHLSDLMRYTLKESVDGKVSLEQEVSYIENYIELFRMRFAPEFYVTFKADGLGAGRTVASLVLIPFVENAFKHGVVNDPVRPVRIGLSVTGDRMTFSVSNKINRNQKDPSGGVGLANIRRRLELLYPEKHELMVSENGQTYKTTLHITLT
ncbi:MAG TPA: sensor histidine kinase [Sphingobacteriaceae bacterium]